jgi:putative endonuclease
MGYAYDVAVKSAVHRTEVIHRCPSPPCVVADAREGGAMRVKDAVGRFGEDLAARHLGAAGMTILERNWRCLAGELDIVAEDAGVLVFVEVKTRSSLNFGDPAEAVNAAKAARLRRLALTWLAEHSDQYWPQLRFDVVAVLRLAPGGPSVRHLRGAF